MPIQPKTYATSKLDETAYAPDPLNAVHPNGFIEYLVQFTNVDDAADTFQQRIQTDGTDLDFQNECRKLLVTKFAPPPVDQANATHTFAVGQTVNILS